MYLDSKRKKIFELFPNPKTSGLVRSKKYLGGIMKNKKEKMKYQLRMAQGAYKKSAPILTLLCDRSENNGLSFVVGVVSI